MFYCLATSLDIAFKWCLMFDLDQTFLPSTLHHTQMFAQLAGCKENHFYSLPLGQAEASIY